MRERQKQRYKDRERFKKREKRGDTCWRKDAHVICLLHFQPAVRKDIPTGPLIHVNYHNSSLRNHSGMWFINDVDFFLKRNVIGAFFCFFTEIESHLLVKSTTLCGYTTNHPRSKPAIPWSRGSRRDNR